MGKIYIKVEYWLPGLGQTFSSESPKRVPLLAGESKSVSIDGGAVIQSTDITCRQASATSWVQSRLSSLYEATNDRFQDAFEQAFAPTCEVHLDHAVHSLQTFKDNLASRRTAATHVSVAWNADIISTNDDKPAEPAVVAGALVVTRSLPYRIRAGPAQRFTHVHFSAKVEQDATAQGEDQRRITSLYYTAVDNTPPIHFSIPRPAQEDTRPDSQ